MIDEQAPAASHSELDEAQPVAASVGRVLVVDDDPIVRRLIGALLQNLACDYAYAVDGADALNQAITLPPDLILLDLLLPDVDGLIVLRQIRDQPALAEVPIIMVTSLADADARRRSLELGADDFITKPIDFLELRARVGSILRLNRYRRLVQERANRQRAEEEIVKRNRELLLLNEFIVVAAARLQSTEWRIDAALHDACRVIAEALGISHSWVWLSGAAGELNGVAAYPEQSPLAPPDAVDQVLAAQGQSRQAMVIYPESAASPVLSAWMRSQQVAAALLIPVPVSGVLGGIIAVCATTPRTFDARELAFGQSLAGALGQVVESALLQRQMQHHVDSLEETVAHRTHELQSERDRTQAILEALGEAVIVADAECTVSYVNPAMTHLSGYAAEELIGRNWCHMQRDEASVALCRQIRAYVGAGNTWRGEFTGWRRDETSYDVMMTVAPIFAVQDPGRLVSMVSIQRDITPLKEAQRAKDRFISNVSHELRTPLSVITLHSGNLETLYDRLTDDQRRRLIREIRSQADLLNELIGDVLELSRMDSGRLRINDQLIDLGELMALEWSQLQALAERRGLRYDANYQAGLTIRGDDTLLRQAIRNLISNAIKFTEAGGSVRAECALMSAVAVDEAEWPGYTNSRGGHWVGLRIVDSGIGIAPEHRARLFDRFYRVQNQTKIPGTGLGLAITRELVLRHGGWLDMASSLGEGSIFAFYLPLAQD